MKLKLQWKLTFIFCGAVLVGLAFGYFYLTDHLKSYLEKNREADLKKELFLSRALLETDAALSKDLGGVDAAAHRIGEALDLRATVIAEDGTVVGDSEMDPEARRTAQNHKDRPEIRDAFEKGFGISKRHSISIGKDLLYVAVPFKAGQNAGCLRLALPLSVLEDLEAKMLHIVIYAIGLIFLLSLFLTYIVSTLVSKPLKEMSQISRAMALGDFSRKPLIYPDDEIGDLAKAFAYMSERIKEQIEKIKKEGAKLDAVLSSMLEGIMVVDEKGSILLANPSIRKFFYMDLDPEQKAPIEVIRHAAVQDIVDGVLRGGKDAIGHEISLSQPQERVLQVNGVPILRNNRMEGAVLVFHDITELRRLEKVRQDFVANVSHELRTPIASIQGYAETLLDGAIDDKKNAKDFVKIIAEDSRRLARLIEDLLDLSKIESGKMKMVPEPLEIGPTVKRILKVLEKPVKNKSISAKADIPEDLPKVLADPERLSQVFMNLLDNAVKYTPEGGSVTVTACRDHDRIRVDVSDSGIGIPETDLPRIFERFYRVDKSRSQELGGTGLGLSIVKHIVQAHGGEVSVRSVLGQGSTFSFTLTRA